MDSGAVVERAWADARYRFRLGLAEVEELEEKCNSGIFRIYGQLSIVALGPAYWDRSDLRWNVVREVIRLGLIGGEEKPSKAFALVERYVSLDPIASVTVALEIAAAFIDPKKDDPLGKAPAVKDVKKATSETVASPSPQSMAPAQP